MDFSVTFNFICNNCLCIFKSHPFSARHVMFSVALGFR